jgi:hypothetical protein
MSNFVNFVRFMFNIKNKTELKKEKTKFLEIQEAFEKNRT